MKIMLKHKGYIGSSIFDEKANLFHGKVFDNHYPITFQGKSIESTKQAFKDAIDEYLDWRKKRTQVSA